MINQFKFTLILFSIFISNTFSQVNHSNLNDKWFFGAEIGYNRINSFELNDNKNSLQGGILAEYYIFKNWSVLAKVKFVKTGVSFFHPEHTNGSGWFSSQIPEYSGTFHGETITIPIYVKWNFILYKKLKSNLKIGVSYNIETNNSYSNYSSNLDTSNYETEYFGGNISVGLEYYLNNSSSIYLDFELQRGTSKGETFDYNLLSDNHNYITEENMLFSVGYKFNLQSKQKLIK